MDPSSNLSSQLDTSPHWRWYKLGCARMQTMDKIRPFVQQRADNMLAAHPELRDGRWRTFLPTLHSEEVPKLKWSNGPRKNERTPKERAWALSRVFVNTPVQKLLCDADTTAICNFLAFYKPVVQTNEDKTISRWATEVRISRNLCEHAVDMRLSKDDYTNGETALRELMICCGVSLDNADQAFRMPDTQNNVRRMFDNEYAGMERLSLDALIAWTKSIQSLDPGPPVDFCSEVSAIHRQLLTRKLRDGACLDLRYELESALPLLDADVASPDMWERDFVGHVRKHRIQWLVGDHGTGKSTVMRNLFDYINDERPGECSERDMLAIRHHFRFSEEQYANPRQAIRSLCDQLCNAFESFGAALSHAEQDCSFATEPDIDIGKLFQRIIYRPMEDMRQRHERDNNVPAVPHLVVLLDALDECSSPQLRDGLLAGTSAFTESEHISFVVSDCAGAALSPSKSAAHAAHRVIWLQPTEIGNGDTAQNTLDWPLRADAINRRMRTFYNDRPPSESQLERVRNQLLASSFVTPFTISLMCPPTDTNDLDAYVDALLRLQHTPEALSQHIFKYVLRAFKALSERLAPTLASVIQIIAALHARTLPLHHLKDLLDKREVTMAQMRAESLPEHFYHIIRDQLPVPVDLDCALASVEDLFVCVREGQHQFFHVRQRAVLRWIVDKAYAYAASDDFSTGENKQCPSVCKLHDCLANLALEKRSEHRIALINSAMVWDQHRAVDSMSPQDKGTRANSILRTLVDYVLPDARELVPSLEQHELVRKVMMREMERVMKKPDVKLRLFLEPFLAGGVWLCHQGPKFDDTMLYLEECMFPRLSRALNPKGASNEGDDENDFVVAALVRAAAKMGHRDLAKSIHVRHFSQYDARVCTLTVRIYLANFIRDCSKRMASALSDYRQLSLHHAKKHLRPTSHTLGTLLHVYRSEAGAADTVGFFEEYFRAYEEQLQQANALECPNDFAVGFYIRALCFLKLWQTAVAFLERNCHQEWKLLRSFNHVVRSLLESESTPLACKKMQLPNARVSPLENAIVLVVSYGDFELGLKDFAEEYELYFCKVLLPQILSRAQTDTLHDPQLKCRLAEFTMSLAASDSLRSADTALRNRLALQASGLQTAAVWAQDSKFQWPRVTPQQPKRPQSNASATTSAAVVPAFARAISASRSVRSSRARRGQTEDHKTE